MRLIDADELYRKVSGYQGGAVDKTVAKRLIEQAPTVDAVEVVRCKDCKHLELLNEEEYYARCTQSGRLFKSFGSVDVRIHSCGRGERRTDGQR